MLFKLDSFTLIGIDAIKVSVEVHISRGLPEFIIVGLPGKAVNESRQRVRSAIINSGFDFPVKKLALGLDIKASSFFMMLWAFTFCLIFNRNPNLYTNGFFIFHYLASIKEQVL